ncbi:fumarylacetoacetate hydrolase family protein [Caldisericum exile]|uniref:Fumarylacetoacetate hydrolase family protein n=1 Tax=Caldisericum exile (strain DSM 21853 / NBRC 104410 / AZM16c01) TaxID=511051 RepID=A0A7U6GFY2_CALEA|nr:fumarylacetoacetate hydrolase family protein [Caldisericum exile]BAL81596.1 fumarylacetoacetate hydrolase family protein [Caldisericum exile AZM16c01]
MKLFVFEKDSFLNVGIEDDGHKVDVNKLSEAMEHIGEREAPYIDSVSSAIENFEDIKKMIAWGKKTFKEQFYELFKVNVKKYYPPIDKSSMVICLGKNYLEHAKETGGDIPEEPILFGKFATLSITDSDIIMYPKWATRIDPEPELALVIGKECKDIHKKDAFDCVFGYTIVNDITERDIEFKDMKKGLPWFRSKNFDTSLSIGPYIVTKDEIKDPHNLEIELYINGILKQKGNTKDMIFKIDETIAYISKYFTLNPGDVISTGTIPGILPLQKEDEVIVKIEKIGELKNKVSR